MKLFPTIEEARSHWEALPPVEGYAEEHTKKSAEYSKRAAESFRRCDTDGCVSQFCDNLNSLKETRKHEIMMHGSSSVFPVLTDLEGNLVTTKRFRVHCQFSHSNKYVWSVNGKWMTDYKRESSFTKQGLKKAWIVAPCYIGSRNPLDRTIEPTGFSGLTSVSYFSILDRKVAGISL